MSFAKPFKNEQKQDDSARLLCTAPGCGRRWSVQLDKPQCSFHAWGRHGDGFPSLASVSNDGAEDKDGKRWARRILKLHDQGQKIRPVSLDMAKKALKIGTVLEVA